MFSMLILWNCTEKTETLLEKSAPALAVRGPCGKHWFLRKAGRVPTARAFLAVLEFQGLAKAEEDSLLHRQNSNVTVSTWSLTWICNEERLSKNTLQCPIRKVFKAQILAFVQNERWVPAADAAYGSPSPCLGWGNWVCRGHIWNCSWQIPSPASDLLPCTVCTGFSPASSRCWELIWPLWLIFLCRNRNQIPQENYEVWENLCLIRYRCSCSPWQCTVRVLLAFNIWWPWVTCTALAS